MRYLAAAAVLALVLTSCRGTATQPPGGDLDELVVQVASYDLAVGEQRLIVGLLTDEQDFVSFGTVQMSFAYLGTRESPVSPEFGAEIEGHFLPLPGEPEVAADRPSAGPASHGRGVYSARLGFDRAGFWAVRVNADVEGRGEIGGSASFEVLSSHRVPAPGDPAIGSENLTLDSHDAPPEAIDSRARTGDIPDPELHQTTIAAALDAGTPLLVVFSTPVFCVSQFCGPVTDMVGELARDYSGRAAFVHVEVWRDFENRVLNRAAADWLMRDGDLQEPWVFLIGADGKITARWDNVATRGEIEPLLQSL